jgi:hypothetical protein
MRPVEGNRQSRPESYGLDKRPWFGPKLSGMGYRPQTWQGYLITAVLVLFVVIVATLTKGHSLLILIAVVPAIVIPIIISWIQRR